MKRIIVFWLVLLVPVIVFAKEYESSIINMKISVNANYIVLMQDNLENNPDLEKLNVTKENMLKLMQGNNIYFDIVKSDLSYEILVVVPKTKVEYSDLSHASDLELRNLKEAIIKETGDKVPIIYKNDYTFMVVSYYDDNGYYNVNYHTVINHQGYNIQLQKKGEITIDEQNELREIIDSIYFKDFDVKKDNSVKSTTTIKKSFDHKIIVYSIIIGVIAGLITYYILAKHSKKK